MYLLIVGILALELVEHRNIEHLLKLFEEQLTYQFVSLVNNRIKFVHRRKLSNDSNEVGVQAVHINREPDDIMEIRNDVGNAFPDQQLHAQEVAGNEDGYNILEVEHRLFAVHLFLFSQAFVVCLLAVLQVLRSKHAVTLLVLEVHVFQKPLEDFDVAVHGNVYFACFRRFVQIFLEVLHVFNQQFFAKFKRFVHFSVFVVNVDLNLILVF